MQERRLNFTQLKFGGRVSLGYRGNGEKQSKCECLNNLHGRPTRRG